MNKKYYAFICVILSAVIFVVILGSRSVESSAENNISYESSVSYISYSVRTNDTLWNLAEVYADELGYSIQDYIDEVKSVNRMKGNTIVSGHYLILPVATK